MRVRLIVADQSEARFYDLEGADSELQPAGRLTDTEPAPLGQGAPADKRPHDRTAVAEMGRRVVLAPNTANAEPRPRKDAAMRFARQIGSELEAARRAGGYDRVVLIAGPAFIGLLRSALPDAVRATLVAEVRKDLLGQPDDVLQAYVPPEAFA